LLWFSGCLVAALLVFDGGVRALADRLTTRREAPPGAGPVFAAPPAVVAAAGDDDTEPPPDEAEPTKDGPPKPETRGKIGALEDVCLEGTRDACKRWGMDGFYRSVDESKRGKLGRAVRVSWYGDSVIATDAIPSRLRARLQAELGDGGPGFLFVVPPHRFCLHEGISRSTNGDWSPFAVSTNQAGDQLYGVGGSVAETFGGRSTIKLLAGKASQVELYYLSQPKGGTARVSADGTEVVSVDTKSDTKAPGYATATIASGAVQFKIETEGKIRLFGIDLENATGAVVDNLGVVSVNVKNFAMRDTAHFAAEVGHRSPDLVMIMIGANEAQWLGPRDHDTLNYAANYEKALAPLRKARPDGACLVVSPTDQAEAKDGGYPSRPVMPVLIEQQRRAAHAQGCAFYSTYAWMGGRGSAARWFRNGLVGSDFQHLSRKGANKMADGVFDALMTGFRRYAHP
jgi:lysophospholipase L1-like esterase